jgi:hypothetical protein
MFLFHACCACACSACCACACVLLLHAEPLLFCCSLARSAFCSSFCCCNAAFSSANLTKKLLNVRWNTPLGATGAAAAAAAGDGVGAGAGAGPGKGAGGAGGGLLRSSLFSHPPNFFPPNPGNPGASELIYILRCRYHVGGQKTLFTRGEFRKVRYIKRRETVTHALITGSLVHNAAQLGSRA